MTYQGVANGEYPLGPTFEQGAFEYLKGGAPIGLIYPSEGTAITLDGTAIIKNAPHPNAGKLFHSWMHSREGQQLLPHRRLLQLLPHEIPRGHQVSDDQLGALLLLSPAHSFDEPLFSSGLEEEWHVARYFPDVPDFVPRKLDAVAGRVLKRS